MIIWHLCYAVKIFEQEWTTRDPAQDPAQPVKPSASHLRIGAEGKNVPDQVAMMGTIIVTICGELSSRQNDRRWSEDVLLTALRGLSDAASVAEVLRINASMTSIMTFVHRLCEFILMNIHASQDKGLVQTSQEQGGVIISAAFRCLGAWLIAAPWILTSSSTLGYISNTTIECAKWTSNHRDREGSAKMFITTILKHHCWFRNHVTGTLSTSSLLSEKVRSVEWDCMDICEYM